MEPLEPRVMLAGDMVLQWNNVLLDAVRAESISPPLAARAMAIVHTSIYDAVNAIDRTHQAYLVEAPSAPMASREAAVAAAAHRALTVLMPAQAAAFDGALTASLATVPDGPAEDAGVALGAFVADSILAIRSTDGFDAVVSYTPGDQPGDWQPTPDSFAAALLPQWPRVTPWAMTNGSQFTVDDVPDLTSTEYAAAFNEVKELGRAISATRTADQTDIALFWANGGGTATPPGHLNVIAQLAAESQGNTLSENARLFALLNIALADAAIASWDAKFATDFWRPITGIRQADTDGNPDTEADATWTPLIATPPFPTYTSGHSVFSAAGAEVLAAFFGTDAISFTLPSENPAVSERSFSSFSEAALESAVSRLYGGIHWRFDSDDGVEAGQALGQFVVANFLALESCPIIDGNGISSDGTAATFVRQLYEDLLDREPDAGGLQSWLDRLDGDADSTGKRREVIEGFLTSREYHEKLVRCMYRELLHRDADANGLGFWADQLGQGRSEEAVVRGFVTSQEFFVLNGSSDAGYVAALYRDLLGRQADADGLQFWSGGLSGGQFTAQQVAGGVLDSDEFSRLRVDDVAGRATILEAWNQDYLDGRMNEAQSDEFFAQLDSNVGWRDVQLDILALGEYFEQSGGAAA